MLKHILYTTIATSTVMNYPSVMANDWFIGITSDSENFISSATGINAIGNNGNHEETPSNKIKSTYTGLKMGTYMNENIRLYANLGRLTTSKDSVISVVYNSHNGMAFDPIVKSKIKSQELSTSLDYVDNLLRLKNTKFFVGGTIGYTRMTAGMTAGIEFMDQKKPNNKVKVAASEPEKDFATYGIQFGLIQAFTPGLSAELGYRYSYMDDNTYLPFTDVYPHLEWKQQEQKLLYLTVLYHF